jgi:hypothetical protein
MAVDLQTRIVNAALDHWPLVAGIFIAGRWLFPKMLRETLSNGGGDIIRGIVKSENDAQTKTHAEELERRFARHEDQEDRRFRTIEERVFRRGR